MVSIVSVPVVRENIRMRTANLFIFGQLGSRESKLTFITKLFSQNTLINKRINPFMRSEPS
jgi:hypothetical protein